VLSGYLIGETILAGIAQDRRLSLSAFYKRRFLRTLPNYYVVLAVYFLFPSFMGGKEPPPLWRFLTFTQNILLTPGTAFSHAWSLCIEEQFYVLLPLLCLAFVAVGRSRLGAWITLAVLLAIGIAARWYYWLHYGLEPANGYYSRVYFGSISRFDEFLPGIAIALLRNFHPATWNGVTSAGNWLLAAGLAAMVGVGALFLKGNYIEGHGYGFTATVFGYSLIAWAFGLLVVAALSPGSLLHRLRIPGATSLALWSYAFYLVHKPIAMVLRRELPTDWESGSPRTIIVIFAASLLGGWLLYRLVETPFMRLRKKIAPSNFTAAISRPEPTSDPAPAHR
jgi:peptidoglycan/LPS O-acetylase OafA/YrhL